MPDEPIGPGAISGETSETRDARPDDEALRLFPDRTDAEWYLVGMAGFWSGWTAICLWAFLNGGQVRSALVLIPVVAVSLGAISLDIGLRRLQQALTGSRPRPWPFGYPSFTTQLRSTLPSVVAAAGRRLGWHGWVVAAGLYAVLFVGLVAFTLTLAGIRS